MRFKLDENLDPRLASLLAEGGQDAEAVLSEGLSGQADEAIYQVCLREHRALVTLDLDFANPLRFSPQQTEGIVVLRPRRAVLPQVRDMLIRLLPQLKSQSLAGRLWIVEPGRIRLYQPRESADEK